MEAQIVDAILALAHTIQLVYAISTFTKDPMPSCKKDKWHGIQTFETALSTVSWNFNEE
jgi:hypothetical protein